MVREYLFSEALNMLALLIVLQVIVAIFLILVVLLQPGNKGGMSAALGGAGGETVFGGRGANTFLSKLTFAAAAVFMITSVSLSFKSMPEDSIVGKALKEQAVSTPQTAPDSKPAPQEPSANDSVVPAPAPTPTPSTDSETPAKQ